MIRPKLSLRRALAVAGAATLGLAASLAVAAPASATTKSSPYQPKVSGEAYCDTETGNWNVSWKVTNSEQDIPGKITAVKLQPAGELTNIVVGAELPRKGKGSLNDEYVVAGDQRSATLTVTVEWKRGKKKIKPVTRSATVKLRGTCEAPQSKPSATFASNCEGVTVTLINREGATKPAEFVVIGNGGFEDRKTVTEGEDTVFVPADHAGEIIVMEGDKGIETYSWEKPEDCQDPEEPGVPTPPTGTYESTCDGLIFEIINPEDGAEVSATFTPNKGEAQTLTVAPGETKSVTFAAAEGLTVTISAEGEDDVTIAWEQPEDCDAGGGGGGALPVTGAQAGVIAGGAAVLVAAGAGLFLMARRRRVTFTA